MNLPFGSKLTPLKINSDERGSFCELFRQEWVEDFSAIQWNYVRSGENVLRGVHVHRLHYDYLVLLEGHALFILKDLRADSPTFGLASYIEVSGQNLQSLTVPPGVAHGFYFFKPSLHIYAVSHYWNKEDELGCRYDDPELALQWPSKNPIISERDSDLPSLSELMGQLRNF